MTRPEWLQPPVLGVGEQHQVASFGETNAVVLERVAALYFPDPGPDTQIVDLTYGAKGGFWTDRMADLYQPVRNDAGDSVESDTSHDFRSLPDEWADRFDVTIIDPPYTAKGTKDGHGMEAMNATYGLVGKVLAAKLLESNLVGVDEAVRVTKPGGVVCIKYADQIESAAHFDGLYQIQRWCDDKHRLISLRRQVFTRGKATPQPPRTRLVDGVRVPTRQQNLAQNTSELLIYRKP